jgi:hypothetical protein
LEPAVVASDGSRNFKFKTLLTPKENLYTLKEQAPDLTGVTPIAGSPEAPASVKLLLLAEKGGEPLSVYGSFAALKVNDKWELDEVRLEFDLQTLGKPRANFGPGTVVANTPEADQALKDLSTQTQSYLQKVKELVGKQQRDQEAQASAERIKRLESLKAGTVYHGTVTRVLEGLGPNVSQEVVFTVTELNGSAVRFEVSNPATNERQTFFGDVQPDRKGMVHISPVVAKPLTANRETDRSRWSFYFGMGSLVLDLVDNALQGEGDIGCWNLDQHKWNTEKKSLWEVPVHYQVQLTRQSDASVVNSATPQGNR